MHSFFFSLKSINKSPQSNSAITRIKTKSLRLTVSNINYAHVSPTRTVPKSDAIRTDLLLILLFPLQFSPCRRRSKLNCQQSSTIAPRRLIPYMIFCVRCSVALRLIASAARSTHTRTPHHPIDARRASFPPHTSVHSHTVKRTSTARTHTSDVSKEQRQRSYSSERDENDAL